MLRTVRSLPSLRVLNSAVKTEVSAVTQKSQRSVHSSSKQNQTTLLNSQKSEFILMSLNALKSECRKRGLKVSGRKSELVSRISAHETSFSSQSANALNTAARPKVESSKPEIKINSPFQKTQPISTISRPTLVSQSAKVTFPSVDVKVTTKNPFKKLESKLSKTFTKSAKPEAKGDDSHIDFIKPVELQHPSAVNDDYITQIPSLSKKASETPVTRFEKTLKKAPVNPNATIVSKAEGSDAKIFENSSVDQIDIQNENAARVTEEVFHDKIEEEGPYEWDNSGFSGNEKLTFFGTLATIGLWWSFKPNTEVGDKH